MNTVKLHKPSTIVPAEYTHCFFYALPSMFQGAEVDSYNLDLIDNLEASGAPLAEDGGRGKCTVCGAVFRLGSVWRHDPTGEYLHVGHICAANYQLLVDMTPFELQMDRLRKRALHAHRRAELKKAKAAYIDSVPGLAEALEADHHIVRDIRDRFLSGTCKYESLSPKQEALVLKIAGEAHAPKPAKVSAPEGRCFFDGTIVSAEVRTLTYGYAPKDVVKVTIKVETPEGVWLAWGTCPGPVCGEIERRALSYEGARVRLKATLSRGDKPHFAFFSRPSCAELIDAEDEAA